MHNSGELLLLGVGRAAGWLVLFALCYGARSDSPSLLRRALQGAAAAACACACRYAIIMASREPDPLYELGIWVVCTCLAATRAPEPRSEHRA